MLDKSYRMLYDVNESKYFNPKMKINVRDYMNYRTLRICYK